MNIESNFEWHRPWTELMRMRACVRALSLSFVHSWPFSNPFWCISFEWHSSKISGVTHTHSLTHTASVDTKLFNNALECDAIIWFHVLECEWVFMLSRDAFNWEFGVRVHRSNGQETERERVKKHTTHNTANQQKLKMMMMMMTIPITKRCFLWMIVWPAKKSCFSKLTQCER